MPVKALNSTARRGGVICATALAALALGACSAGQVTQTSSQVAAVDGASGDAADGSVAVRDVTVKLGENNKMGLKFIAVNQDYSRKDHTLKQVKVDGRDAQVGSHTLEFNCSLVSDTPAGLKAMPQDEGASCIDYVSTELNGSYALGGNATVTFVFDSGEIEVVSTVAQDFPEAGTFER
ncbi:hypothetical protein [Corynebacterium atypicum]